MRPFLNEVQSYKKYFNTTIDKNKAKPQKILWSISTTNITLFDL